MQAATTPFGRNPDGLAGPAVGLGTSRRRSRPIWAVAQLVLVAAVVLSPLTAVRIGANVTASDALLVLGLIGAMLAVAAGERPMPRLGKYALAFAAFVTVGLGGLAASVIGRQPLSGELPRYVIATCGALLLVAQLGSDRRSLRPLWMAYAAGAAIDAGSAFVRPGIYGRAIGLSEHPVHLGQTCVIGAAAAIYCSNTAMSPLRRLAWIAVAVLDLAAEVQSGTRGAMIGLAVFALIYVALQRTKATVFAAAALAYLLAAALAVGVIHLPSGDLLSGLSGRTDQSALASNAERRANLTAAWSDVTDSPVLGKGFSSVQAGHDVYLQTWVGAGVLGLIGFGSLLAYLALTALRQPPSSAAISAGLFALMTIWVTTNVMLIRHQWLFLGLCVGSFVPVGVAATTTQQADQSTAATPTTAPRV